MRIENEGEAKKERLPLAVLAVISLLALLAACAAGTPTGGSGPLGLAAGPYTPLGGVEKNSNPTASDFTDLQAAEAGKIGEPALVEFYADY